MKHRVTLFAALVAAGMFAGCGSEAEQAPTIEFQAGQLVSAEKCGLCHKDIFSFWQRSAHSKAAENESFKIAYREAVDRDGEAARKLCLGCHAPATVITQDYDLEAELTAEGVSCDFCHSLVDTDLSHPDNPFVLEVSEIKFGPIVDAVSTGHEVVYSEFFATSKLCAGCHEYENQQGVGILTTYSEWQEYAEAGGDSTCQDCHMPLVLANIVDPKVNRIEGAHVNSHSTPGGHSLDQLNKSLRVRLMEVRPTSEGLRVKVEVENVGAGHMVPTGSPSRKVVLRLDISTAQGKEFQEERLYEKVLLDESGDRILKDSQLFTVARSLESDSRISFGEERIEEFLFPGVADENVTVTATLTYLYSPHDSQESETRIDFFSETRKLETGWER